jgi:uncharacterized membrane protein AbrB (regulator of aidB expression)
MLIPEKDERENLIIEYKHLHEDNWQRSQAMWVVNSIFITGSLLVAFQNGFDDFPTPLVSLFLVITSLVLHATGDKLTSDTYKRMEEIRKKLGMTVSTEFYRSSISGKGWYIIRTNVVYILFIFLICVYVYLLERTVSLSLILFSAGLFFLFMKEVDAHSRRASEKERSQKT